jgi:hypothetical protein
MQHLRPLRGIAVLAMPDAGQNTRRDIESVCKIPPGAGVLQLLAPGMTVGVFIDWRSVADMVDVRCCVISAMKGLFSDDDGVQFRPWIVESTELPPSAESLSPGRIEMRHLADRS